MQFHAAALADQDGAVERGRVVDVSREVTWLKTRSASSVRTYPRSSLLRSWLSGIGSSRSDSLHDSRIRVQQRVQRAAHGGFSLSSSRVPTSSSSGVRFPHAGAEGDPLHWLRQPARYATLALVTEKPRELVEILYDVDRAERALRHARVGLTREDPLDAMRRLGELAAELRVFANAVREPKSPTE